MMDIVLHVEAKTMGELRDQLTAALREMGVTIHPKANSGPFHDATTVPPGWTPPTQEEAEKAVAGAPSAPHTPTSEPESGAAPAAPTRERGQPSPGKSRRTKAEIAEDELAGLTPTAAPAATTSSGGDPKPDTSDAQPAKPSAASPEPGPATPEGMKIVATSIKDGVKMEMTRDEVIDAAKAFIAGYKGGRDRGNAMVKGFCVTLGFGRVSEVPADRMQELLDMMGEAA